MEVNLEKLKASLPCDADGNVCFHEDKVHLICENILIHATLKNDDYQNWSFFIDKEDSAKAEEFFNDGLQLCYGTFVDEYKGAWGFHKA